MTNFSSRAAGARRSILAGLLLALLPLLAHAATPVLRLEATLTTGSDVTAFVDQVEIIDAVTGLPVRSAVTNAGFETTGSLGAGSYGYAPTGTGWAFVGNSGIATNSSVFGNPLAPDGSHVGLLQTSSPGAAFSQTLPNLVPGLYRVRLRVAQRNTSPANQGVRVRVDGVDLGTVTPGTGGYTMYNSATFAVARPSTSGVFPNLGLLTTDGSTAVTVGQSATPAVTDVDGDGLLDLLVGNTSGNVARFEQTTANGSVFASLGQLTTDGTTGLSVGDRAAPAVTDVDGDGLLDLLVGNYNGYVGRFEQTLAGGNVFASLGALTTDGTTALDVFAIAAPAVTDVDGDGLLDLLVGDLFGGVTRFEQTTANGSVFASLGQLTTDGTTGLSVSSYSKPTVTDVDGDGLLDLLVGANNGKVQRFEQTTAGGNVFAPLGLLTTNGSTAVQVSLLAAPVVTDVDGDGLLDMLVGDVNGNVGRYEQATPPTALALAPAAVAENAASGTVVGTFTTTDATPGDTFTYTLVAGTGSTDNAQFAIGSGANAGKLVTAAVFDFETKSSYSVRVRSTDATGLFTEQFLTISITNVLELPIITSFSPASGAQGSTFIITGTKFTGTTSVRFGELPAVFVVNSATQLSVTVPRGASTHKLRVTTGGGTVLSATAFGVTKLNTDNFPLVTATFSSIAVGGASAPAITDLDGDGLLDLLVGKVDGTLSHYEQAAANSATLALVTASFNAINVVQYSAPAFTDLDGDGLLDMLVGKPDGQLSHYEQAATNSTTFALVTAGFNTIDVGNYSAPTFTDLDGDGLLDMLVGKGDGTLSHYAQAAANSTTFALVTASFNTIDVGTFSFPAFVDLDGDGLLDMLVGKGDGTLSHYEQAAANSATFTLVTASFNGIAVGNYSAPAFTDLDGDGLLDMLAGEIDGNLNHYEQALPVPAITSFTPGSGPVGTSVTITGTDLAGVTAVTVNGVAGTITGTPTATSLTFVVGAGSSTGPIGVVAPGGTGTSSSFTVVPLTVTALAPTRNLRNAPVGSNVAVTFSQTLQNTAATQGAVQVFSQQRGGRMGGSSRGVATVSGSTISFDPTNDFKPGETLYVTTTTAATATGGATLARGLVHQFTAATGGTGVGNFVAPVLIPEVSVNPTPRGVAVGDVDGDGDLDLLTANNTSAGTVSVRLNDGSGNYTAPTTNPNPAVGSRPRSVVLGDVDGDGDLDIVTANGSGNTVSVRLNNGSGNFTAPALNPDPAVGTSPFSVALGDVDGDGDLDFLAANSGSTTVSVRLNNGSGNFTAPALNPEVAVGTSPQSVALGDVDGDGDLDLMTANYNVAGTVSVRLNDGSGNFTAPATNPEVSVGSNPTGVTLGDVDGDGDLDLLTANNIGGGTVSVRLNDGSGSFTAPALNPNPAVGSNAQAVTVGDVDSDGDLDLLTANTNGTVSVRFNDGTGNYTGITNVGVGMQPFAVALGDVDGDGDLDMLCANNSSFSVSVRLNQSLLTITALAPTRNQRNAPVGSNVAVTFSQTLQNTAATQGAVKVFSQQRGGRMSGNVRGAATVSGSTVSFDPTNDFKPGETVYVTTTTTATGTTGATLARGLVHQFTAATGGSGRGNFQPGTSTPVSNGPWSVAAGDVDGDGDLDYVTANNDSNSLSVRLNGGDNTGSNTGLFSAGSDLTLSGTLRNLALGDVDGDGDLDVVATCYGSSTVSVRLNGGDASGSNAGTFGNGSDLTITGAYGIALGDVDGDGDLDLVTANTNGTATIRLNGGDASGSNTGTFAGGSTVGVGATAYSVALGDVDGDGDLDLLVPSSALDAVSVRLNGGNNTGSNTGTFSGTQNVSTGLDPTGVVVGDVDGDGDLDLLTANAAGNSVSVRLNGGDASGSNTGLFGGGSTVAGNGSIFGLALGDVDGDGDLDLVASNQDGGPAMLRLNGGDATGSNTGVFAGGGNVALPGRCQNLALADVDGDNDLDLLLPIYDTASGSVLVRLNQPPAPVLTSLSPAAELPGMAVVLTGTGFTAGSTVSFGGVAASSVTYTSPTSLTAVVPVGAAVGGSAVAAGTANGSSSLPGTAFEVLQVYRSTAASGCLSTDPLTLSGTGGAGTWRYLRLPGAGGAVVAAIEDTYNLGIVTAGINALGTATSDAVRVDGRASRRYLDRNFYLTATNPAFPGQTVRVRFFGLSAELARLTAVDGSATATSLNASQYDGANVNCTLADNDPNGERRLLPAPATVVSGADWFTAEVAVADHFSEFYLTGASSPLPVELLTFSAGQQGSAVALAWRTASEKNSARFEVQRSRNGRTFERIGMVAAQGTKATPTSYQFLDAKYPGETNVLYYRLRQVDLDGSISYSPVRVVTIDGQRALTLYPNPARAGQVLTVTGLAAGTTAEVLDALGRRLLATPVAADGTARFALPSSLAGGTYVLRSGAQARRLLVE